MAEVLQFPNIHKSIDVLYAEVMDAVKNCTVVLNVHDENGNSKMITSELYDGRRVVHRNNEGEVFRDGKANDFESAMIQQYVITAAALNVLMNQHECGGPVTDVVNPQALLAEIQHTFPPPKHKEA